MKQTPDFSRAFGRADKEFVFRVQDTLNRLQAKEEKQVKRKLSVGLIVIFILLLLAMSAAVALTIRWGHIETAMDLAMENGAYEEWKTETKIAMIESMKQDGFAVSDQDMKALTGSDLTEEEKDALADDILTAYYGDKEYLYYYTIAVAEWGEPWTWTLEQKHWFFGLQREKGLLRDDSWIDLLPEESDIQREEAVSIAREAVKAAYELSQEEADGLYPNVSFFITDECSVPRWQVDFLQSEAGSIRYEVLLNRAGEVIDGEDLGILTPEKERRRREETERELDDWQKRTLLRLADEDTVYCNPEGGAYYHFLADCPMVSQEYLPLTAIGKDGESFSRLSPCPVCVQDHELWSIQDKIAYGAGRWKMPEESWITAEEAVQIARDALEKQRFDLEGLYPDVTTSTDWTEENWYVVQFVKADIDPLGWAAFEPVYSVVIDALTGEVISAGEAHSNG